jgi:hypothetical protein
VPRNGANIYSAPAGTLATTQTVIESAKYNAFVNDLVTDANTARPVVAGGTGSSTASGARTNLGAQAADATLTSLSGLTLAADKGLYSTAADTLALFDLTAAGRALLDDANAAAQRVTLGLGSGIAAATPTVTDANSVTESGFYTVGSPFTNAPTANAYRMIVSMSDANNGFQIAALSGPDDTLWYRQKVTGTWRAWVQIIDSSRLRVVSAGIVTTSGTAAGITGIPTWANWLRIYFVGVSLSGTDNLLVRIGPSAGLETTLYSGVSQAGATVASSFSGFPILVGNAAYDVHGSMEIRRTNGNLWSSSHAVGLTNGSFAASGGGSKVLAATLSQVSVIATGSNTFDAGQIVIEYGR